MPTEPLVISMLYVPTPLAFETGRLQRGIHARSKDVPATKIRFNILELKVLTDAASKQGVTKHHLIRQAAVRVAEAILEGREFSYDGQQLRFRDGQCVQVGIGIERYRFRQFGV